MAWIESHQALERHPKILQLRTVLGIPLDECLGRVHRFWWWCLDYALDGDLVKFQPIVIENACGIPLEALKQCGLVDTKPNLRVHDWWQYAGRFISIKYKNYPKKWEEIRDGYIKGTPKGTPKGIAKGGSKGLNLNLTNQPNQPTYNNGAEPSPALPTKDPNGAYEIRTPEAALIVVYKLAKGFQKDDRAWDKTYFKRFSKSAKQLLEFFSRDYNKAADCLLDLARGFDEKSLTWTFETVVKNAENWERKNRNETAV